MSLVLAESIPEIWNIWLIFELELGGYSKEYVFIHSIRECVFLIHGRLEFNEYCIESMEHVDLYLGLSLFSLEVAPGLIVANFSEIKPSFWWIICSILDFFPGWKVIWEKLVVHWTEFVDFYLGSSLVLFERGLWWIHPGNIRIMT